MSIVHVLQNPSRRRQAVWAVAATAASAALVTATDAVLATLHFVVAGLISVTAMIIPGVLLAAALMASGADGLVSRAFNGNLMATITTAALAGALIPVCGITVLPLMAGLLAARVPLAPVMAFWLSSPVTGPPMFAATAATLGLEFAIGKTLAAVGLGLFGGVVTSLFQGADWTKAALRPNAALGTADAACGRREQGLRLAFWREPARRARFVDQTFSITRLIMLVLIPAFAAEYWLNTLISPGALSGYVGEGNPAAIPIAVLIGAPAYIDGYAALPLTRGLMEAGMGPGAAMAFLVAGGVVSVWGAMAIAPVLRLRAFLLYLTLAATGSMLAGWAFGLWIAVS